MTSRRRSSGSAVDHHLPHRHQGRGDARGLGARRRGARGRRRAPLPGGVRSATSPTFGLRRVAPRERVADAVRSCHQPPRRPSEPAQGAVAHQVPQRRIPRALAATPATVTQPASCSGRYVVHPDDVDMLTSDSEHATRPPASLPRSPRAGCHASRRTTTVSWTGRSSCGSDGRSRSSDRHPVRRHGTSTRRSRRRPRASAACARPSTHPRHGVSLPAAAPCSDELIAGGDVSVTGYRRGADRSGLPLGRDHVPRRHLSARGAIDRRAGSLPRHHGVPHLRPGGSERWLLDSFTLLKDEDGAPIAQEGILLYVTERHVVERALRVGATLPLSVRRLAGGCVRLRPRPRVRRWQRGVRGGPAALAVELPRRSSGFEPQPPVPGAPAGGGRRRGGRVRGRGRSQPGPAAGSRSRWSGVTTPTARCGRDRRHRGPHQEKDSEERVRHLMLTTP